MQQDILQASKILCFVFLHIFVTLFSLETHTTEGGGGEWAYQAKSLGLEVRLPSNHALELGTNQTRGGVYTQAAGYL